MLTVDETYIGGKRKNMSLRKRRQNKGAGRGSVGKATVVGARDRASGKVRVRVVQGVDAETLRKFVNESAAPGASVYTDDFPSYHGMR